MNKLCCLILGLSLFSAHHTFSQDSISNKFQIHAGVQIIPGLTLGWESKDEAYNQYLTNYNYKYDNEHSINNLYIAGGLYSVFYYRKMLFSARLLISSEKMLASYVDDRSHHHYYNAKIAYDIEYKAKYLEIPLSIGLILNEHSEIKKTYLEAGASVSFIYYEKMKQYNSTLYDIGNGNLIDFNEESISKKMSYNRTCLFLSLGRETPFIKHYQIYFKRALTCITVPIDIKRNTTEIFTSSRLGLEFGFSYRFK